MDIETQAKENKNLAKKNKLFWLALITLLFIVLLIVLGKYYYTENFKVREYGITNHNLPNSFDGIKIIQFSDVHYNTSVDENFLKRVVNEINELKPEIVIFNGDLFDQNIKYTDEDFKKLTNILNKIDYVIGKYAVFGENDYKYEKEYNEIMNNSGFKILRNNFDLIYYQGSIPIFIGGLDSLLKEKSDINQTLSYFEENDSNLFKLIVMHEPDNIKNLKNKNIDLCLAGHSHNGQIKIPFIGAIHNYKGSKLYYDDYYQINNTDLYISNGLGTTLYKFRLFNMPSFNLFRLYSK